MRRRPALAVLALAALAVMAVLAVTAYAARSDTATYYFYVATITPSCVDPGVTGISVHATANGLPPTCSAWVSR